MGVRSAIASAVLPVGLQVCLAVCLAASVSAQEGTPLSAIDWLDALPTETALPVPAEPETTQSATIPNVTVAPLDGPAPRRVGLVPPQVTGLPDTLWSSSDGAELAEALGALPTLRLPALQQLAFTLLLAEAAPPKREAQAFDLARIDMLLDYGALDPAVALMEQAGADASRAHFAQAMDMGLIAGTTDTTCAILRAQPQLSPGKGHEVFCAARAGDWTTAALQLGSARVLDLLEPEKITALERFLDPELFEGQQPLPLPSEASPLMFRIFAAAGQPIPTRGLPVVFANADLSDTAGWKTRIEAAERLAQSGSLPDNRLLGLYSQRQAAASGGVWDRVIAVQRFETALNTRSASAISKTLPAAWRAMSNQRLRVVFAGLFAEQMSDLVLGGTSADIAFEMLLLSPGYETAAQVFPARGLRRPVLAAVASGSVPADLQASGLAGAAAAAFRGNAPADARAVALARDGRLGRAILRAIVAAHGGQAGDVAQFGTGLATLRALGLEDVARRVALQTLLLNDLS